MSFVSYGQDRVDKKPIVITLNKQLTQSTGWMLDKSGQWKSRVNRIPKADVDKVLLDYENDGLGEDNFISYQVGEIKMDDKTYMIIVKKYKDGYYKYESIQRGWTNVLSASYYIFDTENYNKIKKVEFDSKNIINVKPICWGDLKYVITNENMLYHIKKDISEKRADGFSYYGDDNTLGLIIQPITKNSKVRFIINTLETYHTQEDMDKSFTNSYFETSLSLFNSFIPILNKEKGDVVIR